MVSQNLKIIVTVFITAVVVGGGVYFWQNLEATRDQITQGPSASLENQKSDNYNNESTSSEQTTEPEQTAKQDSVVGRPVITGPLEGDEVEGPEIIIKGKTEPNYYVWAYVNYSEEERLCVTSNTYASGGAGQADADGNFEFILAEPCSKDMEVFVSVIDNIEKDTGDCRPADNQSELVRFTISGDLPSICNQ